MSLKTSTPDNISKYIKWFFVFFIFLSSCRKSNALKSISQNSISTHQALGAGTSENPNIIFILADDFGYEIPTIDGGQSYSTPNIDRLARQGLRFTRGHSSPLCSPSRFMILTGKYNFRNYFADSWGYMDITQRTIANMMKAAGYATCAAGKWQLDGGDTSIHTFGFDNYIVTKPFKLSGSGEDFDIFYKNPKIYKNANFLPSSETAGKYGEDMCRDYMFNFIDSNKASPFFIYWAPNLPHKPFSPTPDDPEFASWNPYKLQEKKDSVFYPSMVKYLDKEIGMLMDKLANMGLEQNTILIFAGDNGTETSIRSLFNGKWIKGGKAYSTENGTHVPLIVSWPGTVVPQTINNNLIGFTDFLPTIADLAHTTIPAEFGITDGVSFAPQILGNAATPRKWLYTYYDPNRYGPDGRAAQIWAQDTTYKLYDSASLLYNYILDPQEKRPIILGTQSKRDSSARNTLQSVIESYR